jgi:hypothetical protein
MKQLLFKVLCSVLFIFLSSGLTRGNMAYTGYCKATGTAYESPLGGAFLLFAGKFGGEVNCKEIAEQKELAVDGCAKGSKIFKYTLVITKGGQKSTYHATSNVLSGEMQTKLKTLSAGDSFEFSEIKAYLPNGKDIVDVHAKKFVVV